MKIHLWVLFYCKLFAYCSLQNDYKNRQLNEIPSFEIDPKIRKLDLSHNFLKRIVNNSFVNVSSINKLFLNNNLLEKVEVMAFKELHFLIEIRLQYNKLSYLPPDLFIQLNKLQKLYINHNKFLVIPVIKSKSISRLEFDHNQVKTVIFPEEYSKLKTLRVIDISFNKIDSLNYSSFQYLSNSIQSLKLKGNNISQVSIDAFQPISLHLVSLDISFNRHLKEQIFMIIKSFRVSKSRHFYFNAQSTGVKKIRNLFYEVSHLRMNHLNLGDNQIENLENVFKNMMTISDLKLHANNLTFLKRQNFQNLFELKFLDLSNNKIIFIDEGVFDGLKKLRKLDLSSNKIFNFDLAHLRLLNNLEEFKFLPNDIKSIRFCSNHGQLLNQSLINITTFTKYQMFCLSGISCDNTKQIIVAFEFEIDMHEIRTCFNRTGVNVNSTRLNQYRMVLISTQSSIQYQKSWIFILLMALPLLICIVTLSSVYYRRNKVCKKRRKSCKENIYESIKEDANSYI